MASVATKKSETKSSLILPGNDAFAAVFGTPKQDALERLASSKDQAATMFEIMGDMSGIEVMSNRLLVGIYIEPNERDLGNGKKLHLSKETLKESVYQGTVGLVLKMGSMAFKDDDASKTYFHGQSAKVGDWVVFRSGDSKRVQLKEMDCRFVEDILIDMKVSDPNVVTHKKTT